MVHLFFPNATICTRIGASWYLWYIRSLILFDFPTKLYAVLKFRKLDRMMIVWMHLCCFYTQPAQSNLCILHFKGRATNPLRTHRVYATSQQQPVSKRINNDNNHKFVPCTIVIIRINSKWSKLSSWNCISQCISLWNFKFLELIFFPC